MIKKRRQIGTHRRDEDVEKSVTVSKFCVCAERSGILPGYSLEELVGGELDGAVGEDADHLRTVPLVQRQESLRTHHPHSQQ